MTTSTVPLAALRPLAWSRIGFGLVVLLRTTPLVNMFDPTLGAESRPLLGWPRTDMLRLAAPGFELSPATVKVLCVVRTLAVIAFMLGLRPRWTGLVAAISGYVVVLQSSFGFTFTQHLLFVGLFVLALVDCNTAVSLAPEPARSPRSSLWLVWAFVVSVYAWAAVAKLRRDWFDGRTLELFFQEGKLRGPLAALLVGDPTRRAIGATSVVILELSLVPLLLWPRTRYAALVVACGFHLTLEAVARPDVFGWGMIALLLSFVPLAAANAGAAPGSARE